MTESERRVSAIHRSLTQPDSAGRSRATVGDRQLDNRRRFDLRRRAPLVHGRNGGVPADRGALGVGPGSEVRSAAEPGLRPPHPLSRLLSGTRSNLGIATPNPRICTDAQGDARLGREEEVCSSKSSRT